MPRQRDPMPQLHELEQPGSRGWRSPPAQSPSPATPDHARAVLGALSPDAPTPLGADLPPARAAPPPRLLPGHDRRCAPHARCAPQVPCAGICSLNPADPSSAPAVCSASWMGSARCVVRRALRCPRSALSGCATSARPPDQSPTSTFPQLHLAPATPPSLVAAQPNAFGWPPRSYRRTLRAGHGPAPSVRRGSRATRRCAPPQRDSCRWTANSVNRGGGAARACSAATD